MLRHVLLCFVAGLASSEGFPVFTKEMRLLPSYFNTSFTVKVEVNDLLQNTMTPVSHWYDDLHKKSRMDIFGTTQQLVLRSPTAFNIKEWLLTTVYPVTTEHNGTILQKQACSNTLYKQRGSVTPGVLPQIIGPFDQYFGSFWMEFPSQERVHDEDADRWRRWELGWDSPDQTAFTLFRMKEETWWTVYKMIDGVRQIVPLRYEIIVHNRKTGIKESHYNLDYYEYRPGKLDPEDFDITKGLVCGAVETGPTEENEDLPESSPERKEDFAKFKENRREKRSENARNMRLSIFGKNLRKVEEHNRGEHGYKLALNHLADLALEEVASIASHAPSNTSNGHPFPYSKEEIDKLSTELPTQMDWRALGAVTDVKDQLRCGASWAFAATGAVEAAMFLQNLTFYQTPTILSEQALIDCSWGFGNAGCKTGDVKQAFDWMTVHGLPDTGRYGGYLNMEGNCNIEGLTDAIKLKGYITVNSDPTALKVAIFKHGPVAVKIGLTPKFLLYSNGVFSDPDCPNELHKLTHSALVVGYGELEGQSYWLVKNSWGRNWGVNGYILISTKDNMCGVLTDANYPFY